MPRRSRGGGLQIHPFLIIIFVLIFTGSLGLFFAYINVSKAHYTGDPRKIEFDLVKLQSKDRIPEYIWSEIDPKLQKVVKETENMTVLEWETQYNGKFRALMFTASMGIEGGHSVICDRNDQNCFADWREKKVPAIGYLHSMALAITSTTLSPALICPSEYLHFLHVGLGSGTLVSFLLENFERWAHTVVEIDAEVINIAPQFGVYPSERLRLEHYDIAKFIQENRCKNQYDGIIIDAYDFKDRIPEALLNAKLIAPCLSSDKHAFVVINLVPQVIRQEEFFALLYTYRLQFKFLYLIEGTEYNKILVAHNQDEQITIEELFYRSEFLFRNCNHPLMERGRGHYYNTNAGSFDDAWLWFSTINRQRPCVGFSCLL